jgi:hypothetical protein
LREVSPELVLVDPELAAIERLRLAEDAAARSVSEIPRRTTVVTVTPVPPPRVVPARRIRHETVARLTPTLLLLSFLLNLLFAASLFAGNSQAPTLESAPSTVAAAPSHAAAHRPTKPLRRTSSPTAATTPPLSLRTKGEAEQAVLAFTWQSAAARAPKLVDPTTGLLKNNVQAVCRRSTGDWLLCVVRPARHRSGEGLYVRYRPAGPEGPAQVVWLGYRLTG